MAEETSGWTTDDTISDHEPLLRGSRRRGPRTRPSYRVRFNFTTVTVRPKPVRFFGKPWEKMKTCARKRETSSVDVETLYFNPNFKASESGSDTDLDIKPRVSRIRSLVRERLFAWAIGNLNFRIKKVEAGNSSFFRAVADQMYGDENFHDIVRQQCVDHIEANRLYYASFIEEDFDFYVERMRLQFAYPSNLEMQAVAELYQRTLAIYYYNIKYKMWVPKSPIVHVNYFSSIIQSDSVPVEICYESKLRPISAIAISFHNDNCFKSLRKITRNRICQTPYLHRQMLERLPQPSVEHYVPDEAVSFATPKKIKPRKWIKQRRVCKPVVKSCFRRMLKRTRKKTVAKVLIKKRRTIQLVPHCLPRGPKSSKTWMSLGVEAQRRQLEDAFTGRLPYYYTCPLYNVPRKITKATITSPSITEWSSIYPLVRDGRRLDPNRPVKMESVSSLTSSKIRLREYFKEKDKKRQTVKDRDGASEATDVDWDQPSTSKAHKIAKRKEDQFSHISWEDNDPWEDYDPDEEYDYSSDDDID